MVVLGQKLLCLGKSGVILAKDNLFEQKLLYS